MKKRYSIFIVLLIATAGFMGGFISDQFFSYLPASAKTQPIEPKTPEGIKIVEANQFRLVDLKGKCLAKFTIEETKLSALRLLGKSSSPEYSAVLEISGLGGKMRLEDDELVFREGRRNVTLNSHGLFLTDGSSSHWRIRIMADDLVTGGGARIDLIDKAGQTRAVLGGVELNVMATGEKQVRPESSIVLFGTDGKVVYSAP